MNARNLIARCFHTSVSPSSIRFKGFEKDVSDDSSFLTSAQLVHIKGGVGGGPSENDIEVEELIV